MYCTPLPWYHLILHHVGSLLITPQGKKATLLFSVLVNAALPGRTHGALVVDALELVPVEPMFRCMGRKSSTTVWMPLSWYMRWASAFAAAYDWSSIRG